MATRRLDRTTQWLDQTEAHAWTGLVRTTQLLFDELDRQLRADSGMTHADYQMLVLLSHAPDRRLNITVLANMMRYSQSRVSHAVTRLGGRGWLERCSDPHDGRGSIAMLTDGGFAALAAAAPGHVAAVRANLLDHLSTSQVRQLGAICSVALEHLDAEDDVTGSTGEPLR